MGVFHLFVPPALTLAADAGHPRMFALPCLVEGNPNRDFLQVAGHQCPIILCGGELDPIVPVVVQHLGAALRTHWRLRLLPASFVRIALSVGGDVW